MPRSVGWIALVAAAGCAGNWPGVVASGESTFIQGHAPIQSIDIMPSDVQVWARAKEPVPEEKIGAGLDKEMAAAIPTALVKRGYRVIANLDWSGSYVDERGHKVQALDAQQMVETAWALSSYGAALERAKKGALVPHLPHRLGQTTGADATLYVGGWAYAGKPPSSGTPTAVKVIGVILVVAVVAVVVAAVLDDGAADVVGDVAKGAAKGAAKGGKAIAKTSARIAGGIGRAAIRVGSTTTRVMARAATSIDTIHLDISTGGPDCFGRVDTHAAWYRGRPDYYAQPSTPTDGPSKTMIEMTLVDNRRGEVLWHARQQFPADPKNPDHVRKIVGSMIGALPIAASGPGQISVASAE